MAAKCKVCGMEICVCGKKDFQEESKVEVIDIPEKEKSEEKEGNTPSPQNHDSTEEKEK